MEQELAQIEENFLAGRMKVFGSNTDDLLNQIADLHLTQINTALQHISAERLSDFFCFFCGSIMVSITEQEQQSLTYRPAPPPSGDETDPWCRTEAQVKDILDRGLSGDVSTTTPGSNCIRAARFAISRHYRC